MASSPLRLTSRTLATLSLLGATAFVACTGAAMAVFPGGTRDDFRPQHYLFTRNFLSDLGGTFTSSGRPNGASRPLFIAAMAAVALALGALALALRLAAGRRDRWIGSIALVVALASGAGFVRAATVPWNQDYEVHMTWVRSSFGLLGLFVALMAVLQVRTRAPRWLVALDVGFLLALVAYVVFDQRGPSLFTPEGIEAQVIAQKIIVALAIANLGVQALAARRRAADGAHLRSTA